jgi:hypothetical protein
MVGGLWLEVQHRKMFICLHLPGFIAGVGVSHSGCGTAVVRS